MKEAGKRFPIKTNGTTSLSECAVLQRLPMPPNAARNIYNCTLEFTAPQSRLTGPRNFHVFINKRGEVEGE